MLGFLKEQSLWSCFVEKIGLKFKEEGSEDSVDIPPFDKEKASARRVVETTKKEKESGPLEQRHENQKEFPSKSQENSIHGDKGNHSTALLEKKTQKKPLIQVLGSSGDSNEDENVRSMDLLSVQSSLSADVPRFLYDAYLALLSSSPSKISKSLKQIPIIARQNFDELLTLTKQLLEALLKLQDKFELEGFEGLRMNAIQSVIVMNPLDASSIVIERLFDRECSLGDKLELVKIITDSVRELAGNPMQFALKREDLGPDNPEILFEMKPVFVKICKPNQSMQQIEGQKYKGNLLVSSCDHYCCFFCFHLT